jgi:photosystem II stability/assembly factor-like uncharacterized protein
MKNNTLNKLLIFIISSIIQIPCATAQWFHSNFVALNEECYCLSKDGQHLYAGTYGNVLRSTDNGMTWVALDSQIMGYQNAVISVASDGSNIYAITVDGDPFISNGPSTLWLSTDSGTSWHELNTNFLTPFTTLTEVGNSLFASIERGLFRSNDSGKTWKKLDPYLYVTAVLGNKLFAVSSISAYLYVSTNQGNSWDSIQTQMPLSEMASSGSNLAALSYNPNTTLSSVLYSTDSGNTWNLTSSDSAGSVADLENIAMSGNTIFVGSSSDPGADFYSTDWGASWHDLCVDGNCGDPGRETALIVSGPNLVLTSHTTGIYYYPLGGLASVTQTETSQLSFSSSPNPITSTAAISFTLPFASAAHLTLTDAAGRETSLLPTQWLDAGPHQVTWDAGTYPNGVYLCRLVSGSESATQRLVVLH